MDSSPQPHPRFLHTQGVINPLKLEAFRRLSTDSIKLALQPGKSGSLKVRPDGTVLDGHHRLTVLLERGEDIHGLPREIITKES
jgi:hypothetical protein